MPKRDALKYGGNSVRFRVNWQQHISGGSSESVAECSIFQHRIFYSRCEARAFAARCSRYALDGQARIVTQVSRQDLLGNWDWVPDHQSMETIET